MLLTLIPRNFPAAFKFRKLSTAKLGELGRSALISLSI